MQQKDDKKMRVLYIDDNVKKEIKRVIDYAESHRLDINKQMKIQQQLDPAVGFNPEYSCKIPDGYRIVYSIEEQLDRNWYRHISVSVNSQSGLPSVPSVEMIIREFGFVGAITDMDSVSIEKDISPMAINVLQNMRFHEN